MREIVSFDVGRYVECDSCGMDLTDDPRSGGLIFSGHGYGPCCAEAAEERIRTYGEEEYIQGRCTPGMSYADWVRTIRAQSPQGSRVTIYSGLPWDEDDDG